MARRDSDNQKRSMSAMFRGRAIFKPLNTGRIDARVACVREWVANIFFYTKNGATIMIDAGYNYARLKEKMGWLDIDPATIRHILITHQDTDHVGALEPDSERLFKDATVYIGEIENRYLTGEKRRKVIHGLYRLPMVKMENRKVFRSITAGSYVYTENEQGAMLKPYKPSYLDQITCWDRAEEVLEPCKGHISDYVYVRLAEIQIMAALLVAGKIAVSSKDDDYSGAINIIKRAIKHALRRNGAFASLSAGYKIKTIIFKASPGLYLKLYGSWKS